MFNGHQVEIEPSDIITKNDSVFRNEIGVITQVMGEIYIDRKFDVQAIELTNLNIDIIFDIKK